jgi:hypothetical protein
MQVQEPRQARWAPWWLYVVALVVTNQVHVRRVLAKLGLRDRTQAVVAAYESGLVVPGSVP